MTDISKATSATNTESAVNNTADNFDVSALEWIKNHEERAIQQPLSESQKVVGEINAIWAALDGLSEGDFPELAEIDGSVNMRPTSKLTSNLQSKHKSTLQSNQQEKPHSIVVRLRQPQYWGAIAAMLLIALLVPIAYVGVPTDYVVAKGQRDTVILTDGSRIELGSNTRVSVQEGWGQRAVTLELGSAFFTVTPNKEKPFVIH
ncbi:MAG: FecR domain-containing protein, partial [Pseudomonadales bacterium]|nr:FecR domain-containing protein [Pseudomonadales bacterium]